MADPGGGGSNPGNINPESAKQLQATMAATKAAAEAVTKSFNDQLRILTQLKDVMGEVASNLAKMESSQNALSPEKMKEVADAADKAAAATGDASREVNKLSKLLEKKWVKAAVIGISALTGLRQGFKNLVAMGKSVFGFLTGVAEGVLKVAKSMAAVPFKLMTGLSKMATQAGGSTEYAQAIEDLKKQFGDLGTGTGKAVLKVATNMDALNQTGIPVNRLFGNMAERIKAVTQFATDLGPVLYTMGKEFEKDAFTMMAYQKGLGLSGEQMQSVARTALRMGKDSKTVLNDMTKQALGMAKAFGIDAKVISRDMGKAMQDLAHFGHLSTKELAVAATYANKLGVSIDKLTGVMDATSTFDQAAESMSKLNQQFGTNLDATKIMMAQTPQEKVEMLRNEFLKTGKDLSNLTYQERMFIKQNSGMDDSLMDAAFSAKNAGVSLDKITRQGDKNQKKTLTQAEAMQELSKGMERLVVSGERIAGILDNIIAGFNRGIFSTKEFREMMRNLNIIFQKAFFFGFKLGKLFVEAFPGVREILESLTKYFDPAKYQRLFDKILSAFGRFKTKGSQGINGFVEDISKSFKDFFNEGSGPLKGAIDGFKLFGTTLFKLAIKAADAAWKEINKLYDKLMAELRNPSETTRAFLDGLKKVINDVSNFIRVKAVPFTVEIIESLIGFMDPDKVKKEIASSPITKTATEIFKPLLAALKYAWDMIHPKVVALVGEIIRKIPGMMWDTFMALPWQAQALVGLRFLGPAIGNGLVGALSSDLLQKPLMNWASKKMPKLFGDAFKSGETKAIEKLTEAVSNIGKEAADKTPDILEKSMGPKSSMFQKLSGVFSKFGEGFSKLAGFITSPAGIVLAAVTAIGVVAYKAAATYHETEDQLKSRLEANKSFEKMLKDDSMSLDEKIAKADEERKILLARANEEKGSGFINWFRGGAGEAEANIRATANSRQAAIDELRKLKEKQDRELIVGTPEYQAKMAADAEKQRKEDMKRQLDALGPTTIENAEERFKKIQDLSKKLMGKDFDIKKTMDDIRAKLDGVNFTLFTEGKQEEQFDKAFLQVKKLQGTFEAIADIGGTVKVAAERLSSLGNVFGPASKEMAAISEGGPIAVVADTLINRTFMNIDKTKLEAVSANAETVKKAFSSVKEMGESVLASITSINQTFSQIQASIATTVLVAQKVNTAFSNFAGKGGGGGDLVGQIAESIKSISASAKQMEAKGLAEDVKVIGDLIEKIKILDTSIAQLPKFNFPMKLKALADGMGVGQKFRYSVEGRPVVINFGVEVRMSADEVEKVIVTRKQSVIRDRLNYLIENNATTAANANSYIKGTQGAEQTPIVASSAVQNK